jgi:hypothetical protein
MRLAFALLTTTAIFGAVDGTVTNATTGKPQPNVVVMLVQPGQSGMQTLASVKSDADGKFRIEKEYPPGPALLQAIFGGATYNTVLTPGSPTSGVQVKVYEATKDAAVGRAAQHMILLEPTAENVRVSETFLFDNKSNTTFSDPAKGSAQFYLPKNAEGKPQITITSPGGMPITRDAGKTAQANVFKIDYPIRPGETRFDISYTLPAGSSFESKTPDPAINTFLVTPPSVTLSGDGIDSLGEEPQTRAHTYRARVASYEVKLDGTGSLRSPEGAAQQEEDNGSPKIEVAPARIYDRLPWILVLTFAILGIGGVMLFRKGTA